MTVDELRAFVLGLPGAVEAGHHGRPDFRHGGRIVVNLDEEAALVARDDGAFSLPGGWARHGWTTISLDRADPDELRELIAQAWAEAQERRRP